MGLLLDHQVVAIPIVQSEKKHAGCRLHRLALSKSQGSPSVEEWRAVLDDFRGARGTKHHVLRWCLDEALRIEQWSHLLPPGGAKTIALSLATIGCFCG